FAVRAIDGFGITDFGGPGRMSERDILELGGRVCEEARDAEALLISCGGLRTLGVAAPFEAHHGIPVVASTQAAFWAALRLVGASGRLAGFGRLLEETPEPGHLRRTEGAYLMKARVTVTLKSGILDPQGKAIEGALKSLGVEGIASVRQGKVFDIEVAGTDKAKAEATLKQAADKLLANTVIENYRVEVSG